MSIEDPKLGTQSLIAADQSVQYEGGPLDPNNPRSLINICPPEMKEGLEKIPHIWFFMNEKEIEVRVQPDAELNRIRLAFWKEYERAQSHIVQMKLSTIAGALGYPSIMLKKAFLDAPKLAWILCPPSTYDNFLDEALQFGMRRLRDILSLPLVDSSGRVNAKAADVVLKAVAFLDMRKHGGIVNRSLNLNATIDAKPKDLRDMTKEGELEEIDRRIAELEQGQELEMARAAVGPRDAQSIVYAPTDRLLRDVEKMGEAGDVVELAKVGESFEQSFREGPAARGNKKTKA